MQRSTKGKKILGFSWLCKETSPVLAFFQISIEIGDSHPVQLIKFMRTNHFIID
ncbi:MAG: hypothetical protein R2757_12450 [Draconibacterium sp.]